MISFKQKGDFSSTINFLSKSKNIKSRMMNNLRKIGADGVVALSKNTPVDSGLTANSWSYTIENSNGKIKISWNNSNVVNGVPIAILLQYGHGTQNGGWIEGRDYINPALRPIFDKMAKLAWEEVTKI